MYLIRLESLDGTVQGYLRRGRVTKKSSGTVYHSPSAAQAALGAASKRDASIAVLEEIPRGARRPTRDVLGHPA